MRNLVILVLLAFLGYSAWWWLGASAHDKALTHWFEDRRDAGWVAAYDDLNVVGYPNRIDTRVDGLELADPRSGWAWSAPFLHVHSLSYKPNHVIVALPNTQRISSTQATYDILSDAIRGSLVFVPNTDLTLDRLQVELSNVAIASETGTTTLKSGNFATRRITDGNAPDFAHEIGLDVRELSIPLPLLRMIDPKERLPRLMETTHIDVIAAFDAPMDRHAAEGDKPRLTALRLRDVHAVWGEMKIQAQGRTRIDRDGFFEGEITIKAQNWRAMIELAKTAGLIPADLARTVTRGLSLVAGLRGGREIEVPLRFDDGATYLGPIPIGPAPRVERR